MLYLHCKKGDTEMDKTEAFRIVYEELKKNPMFCGVFDAKHGNREFMYGICTVMENIACHVGENAYEEYSTIWCDNVVESIERGKK